MPHCYSYILALGLAGVIFTSAFPTSDYRVEREQSVQHELQRTIRLPDESLGVRNTLSRSDGLEQLLSEISEYTVSDEIACESPQPQYNQAGLLPHPRSCRKFYICDQQSRKVFIYKCPTGLVFKKEYGLCSIPLSDDAIEDCREPETEMDLDILGTSKSRKRRSTSIRCEEAANNIINAAEEIKTDAITIDHYIAHIKDLRPLVMSLIPLQGQYQNYERVLQNYNADLEKAQKNTRLWKGNSGVYEAVNQTLTETRNFEPAFDEGFDAFLKRIGLILNIDGESRIATYEMINDTKHKITELEKILKGKQSTKNYDMTKTLLEQSKQRLRNLEDAKRVAETKYDYLELRKFLKFVMNHTTKVQKAVNMAEKKIHDFERKVMGDSGKFQRHLSVAMETISILEEESIENKRLKASLPQKKQSLLQQKSSTETSLSDARRKKANVEKQLFLFNLRRRSKRSPFEPFTLLAIATGLIAGAGIVDSITDDDDYHQRRAILNQQLRDYQNNINSLSSRIQYLINSVSEYESEIESLNKKSDTLQRVIAYFSELLPVFQDMEKTVTPVIPLINKAKTSIKSIGKILEEISVKLMSMEEDTTEAEDHLKRRDFKYFIYNEINVMKCTWENVSSRLALLEHL